MERHKEQPKEKERDIHDGRVWVWNSYYQWKENYFRFLSERSLQRIFLALEKKGLIISANYNESPLDKKKWYSVNYDHPLICPITGSESIKIKSKSRTRNDQRKKVVDHTNVAPSISQAGAMDSAQKATSYTKTSLPKISTNTTTTPDLSLLNHTTKKDTDEFRPTNTFQIPRTSEEGDQIVKDVMRIVYPFEDKIRNKNNLVASLKKKLNAGILEIPEGWELWQNVKKEKTHKNLENEKSADEDKAFLKLSEEFRNLPQIEQHKYTEAAIKKASHIAKVASDATMSRLAVMLWSHERR